MSAPNPGDLSLSRSTKSKLPDLADSLAAEGPWQWALHCAACFLAKAPKGGQSMTIKRMILLVCSVIILLTVSPSVLFAQMAGSGQIEGTVTDKSGGAIAGATVTLLDSKTNIARTATTND